MFDPQSKPTRTLRSKLTRIALVAAQIALAIAAPAQVAQARANDGPAQRPADRGRFVTSAVQSGPGGVGATMRLWLRANAGPSPATDGGGVNTWVDQSGNNIAVTQTIPISQPTYLESGINFNPAVSFDGVDDYLALGSISTFSGGTISRTILAVANSAGSGARWIFAYGVPITDQAFLLGQQPVQQLGLSGWNSDLSIPAGVSDWSATPRIVAGLHVSSSTGALATLYANGLPLASTLDSSAWNTTIIGGKGYVGRDVGGGGYWQGKIGEVILFKGTLTANELQRVNTYLAVKWGATMTATDYLASDNSTIWSQTANAGYQNDITGIGRDDANPLDQKQSASVNAGNIVTIGLGTIATTNAANPNDFSADISFLIWGHDGAALTVATPITGVTGSRMARLWKTQETGTVESVMVRIPASTLVLTGNQMPYLIKSADAALDSADMFIPLTLNGSEYEALVDYTNGDYFSFGAVTPPDLLMGKSGPATAPLGAPYTYTLVVTNVTGMGMTYAPMTVTDALPAGVAYQGYASTLFACTASGQNVTCGSASVLAAGATADIAIVVSPTVKGTVVNSAQVQGGGEMTTTNDASNLVTTTLTASPVLTITKAGPVPSAPMAGQNVTYTLVVTNSGNEDATSVTLNEFPSTGLSFVGADSPCGSGFPCNIGTLAIGGSRAISVVFQVSLAATEISNTASLTSAEVPTATFPAGTVPTTTVTPRNPDPFGKTAPISGSLTTITNVVLSWQSAVAAQQYRVCVGTASGLCDVLNTTVTSPTTSYTATLPANGTYWWQITALGMTGSGTPADGGTAWTITRGTELDALAGTQKIPATTDMMFGKSLTYTIVLSNVSINPITVTVTDTLQALSTLVSASPAGYSLTGTTLKWTSVRVPALGTTSLVIVVKPMPPPGLQTYYLVDNSVTVITQDGALVRSTPTVKVHVYQLYFPIVRKNA